jgi:uncharacterized protein involved in type VI secretion and phage assembly
MSDKYYGKYRGAVLENIDPLQQARLLVQVPDVLGLSTSSWAMPCVPVAGPQMGVYVLPLVGAGVWVEFEGGNPDYPIWTGGFWGSAAEVPALALTGLPASPNMVFQTSGMNTVIISDLIAGPRGGITLTSASGAFITVNDTGIYIDNGTGASINMIGPQVNINNGALMIT